jgi:hypothetical protein
MLVRCSHHLCYLMLHHLMQPNYRLHLTALFLSTSRNRCLYRQNLTWHLRRRRRRT